MSQTVSAAPGVTTDHPPSSTQAPELVESSAEVQEEQNLTSLRVLAAMNPAEIKNLSDQEREILRDHFVTALKEATSIEARVRCLARVTDVYLVDTIVGAALPVVGDIATSAGAAGYLYYEAKNMELDGEDIAKIMLLQGADAAIGLVPIADLFTDTVFPANVLSARYFTAQLNKLITNAKAAGVPEETIKQLQEEADFLVERLDFIYKIYKWFKEDKKKLAGTNPRQLPNPDKKKK